MQLRMTTEIWQKGSWFITKCSERDSILQGTSLAHVRCNLLEVTRCEELSILKVVDSVA